jgi:hypothetical protein
MQVGTCQNVVGYARLEVRKLLTPIASFSYLGLINPIGIAGIQRQRLALSFGPI